MQFLKDTFSLITRSGSLLVIKKTKKIRIYQIYSLREFLDWE